MPEAVGVVAGQLRAVGPDELLPHQRDEPLVDVAVAVCQRRDRAAVEDAALDRAALEHRTLGRVELVEAGSEQRLDRRRHLDLRSAGVPHEREHLLEEERVALRDLDDPLAQLGPTLAKLRQQPLRLRGVERLEQDACVAFHFPPPQDGRALEQLRPGHTEQQDRRVA